MRVNIIAPLSVGAGSQDRFPDGWVAPSTNYNAPKYYYASVQSFLKGCPPSSQYVVIATGGNSGLCGYEFRLKNSYYFVGYKANQNSDLDIYSTNICTATRSWGSLQKSESAWLKKQQYNCNNRSLCSSGKHSNLFKTCSTTCKSCPGLVCKSSKCAGCGTASASYYSFASPFIPKSGC